MPLIVPQILTLLYKFIFNIFITHVKLNSCFSTHGSAHVEPDKDVDNVSSELHICIFINFYFKISITYQCFNRVVTKSNKCPLQLWVFQIRSVLSGQWVRHNHKVGAVWDHGLPRQHRRSARPVSGLLFSQSRRDCLLLQHQVCITIY